jgi:hypothetical protein
MDRRRRTASAHNLLVRSPVLASATPSTQAVIDIVDQLEELVALYHGGLLSPAEFERQKRKVLDG